MNRWEFMAWARAQHTGSPGRKAVLMCLAERVDEEGYCYPGHETLATETEQSRSTVGRVLKNLELGGFIRRERRHNPHSGARKSDGYWIGPSVNLKGREQPTRQTGAAYPSNAGGPSRHSFDVDNNQSNSQRENTSRAGAGTYTPEFERLWASYPKRLGSNSKRAAFKAVEARLRQGHTYDQLQAGTLAYAIFCEETDRIGTEFVKQAASFYGPDLHFLEPWDLPGQQPPQSGGNGRRPPPGDDPDDPEPWMRGARVLR